MIDVCAKEDGKEMTNIFKTPEKAQVRNRLFEIGIEALQKEGWKVERISRSGKSSVRRLTRGQESKVVSIRTTQNTWIAFPRTRDDTAWGTLADVEAVVAVSVDRASNPQFAQVHLIEGDEMRSRFDRAYSARREAGHSIPVGRGIWISLYEKEASLPVYLVGAGAGVDNPMIARVPLAKLDPSDATPPTETREPKNFTSLTIPEAKQLLAKTLGVDPSCIKITVDA